LRASALAAVAGLLLLVAFRFAAPACAAAVQAPVVVFGNTLFVVTGATEAAASRRASTIAARISTAIADPTATPDAVHATVTDAGATIAVGDTTLFYFTSADAATVDRSVSDAAGIAVDRIKRAIKNYQDDRSPESIAIHAAIALAALAGLIAVTWLIWRLSSRLVDAFQQKSVRSNAVGLGAGVQVPLRPVIEIAVSALRVLRLVVVGFLCYLCVSFVLKQFVLTRDLADALIGPFVGAITAFITGFVAWLPQFAIIVVIGFIAYEATTFLRVVRDEMQAGRFEVRGFESDWIEPTYRLIAFAIWVVTIMAVLPHIPGFDSPSFKAVGLLLSALLTFGSAATISNILAGVVLTYAPSFRTGDYVKVGDAEGEVVSRTLFITQIRTLKNVVVSMPNASVIGATVFNYSAMALRGGSPLILNSTVTIGYDVPWRDMERALIDAALATPHVVALPAPFVLQTSLNDFNVAYQINAYSNEPLLLAQTYSALHANIQDTCNARGIEILSPGYSALRDGNHTTIPASYLAGDYRAPGFRVDRPET
jgi:small-conductance mechanosensitive channel